MKNVLGLLLLLISSSIYAQDTIPSSVLNSMKFRNIGPAITSGRIVDLATDPTDINTYYVAAAYSGVWKTDNAGTTFKPIFEHVSIRQAQNRSQQQKRCMFTYPNLALKFQKPDGQFQKIGAG